MQNPGVVNIARDVPARWARYRYFYRNDVVLYRREGLVRLAVAAGQGQLAHIQVLRDRQGCPRRAHKNHLEGLCRRGAVPPADTVPAMNLTKQICHKAAHFDAVAFDVFDTLIKRDVAVPTGLFRLMGDDFYAARIRAEREARAAQSGEVTLAEIYARPCLARYDAAAECAAELAACAANKPVLDAVQTLKKQGKKLYYISDMYLPQDADRRDAAPLRLSLL